jgi:hypothetical protein
MTRIILLFSLLSLLSGKLIYGQKRGGVESPGFLNNSAKKGAKIKKD